jgi:hypothetical protein
MQKKKQIFITEEIDFDGKTERLIIRGLELRPYWKRLLLVICFWKNPVFIFNHPKIIKKDKREILFG